MIEAGLTAVKRSHIYPNSDEIVLADPISLFGDVSTIHWWFFHLGEANFSSGYVPGFVCIEDGKTVVVQLQPWDDNLATVWAVWLGSSTFYLGAEVGRNEECCGMAFWACIVLVGRV